MAAFDKKYESISWESIPKCWKDADGSNFDRSVLAEIFPGAPNENAKRSALWRQLDGNGSGSVSLAEYDSFVNQLTGAFERKHGHKLVDHKSKLYVYARPSLIRAFNLANGVAPPKTPGDDDFVTRGEFRLLMVATQCALNIFRVFDIADTSNDRRVSRQEWCSNLPQINAELISFGYTGPAMTEADFNKVDADHGGMILLDEAVHFFLGVFTTETHLLHENEAEGAP